jgi:uncharacterized protein (UPF0303 family)
MAYTSEGVLQDEKLISEFTWDRDSLVKFGNQLAETGKAKKLPVAIAIYLEDVKIFQSFLEGTSKTNELWVQRKIDTVRAVGHSTLYLRAVLEELGAYQKLGIENHIGDIAIAGGGVPIFKKGKIFAVLIISGLPHEEDHRMIMDGFNTFKS